jgi:hypothetical protein
VRNLRWVALIVAGPLLGILVANALGSGEWGAVITLLVVLIVLALVVALAAALVRNRRGGPPPAGPSARPSGRGR